MSVIDGRTPPEPGEPTVEKYAGDELVVKVRDRELRTPLTRETLSGSRVRRLLRAACC